MTYDYGHFSCCAVCGDTIQFDRGVMFSAVNGWVSTRTSRYTCVITSAGGRFPHRPVTLPNDLQDPVALEEWLDAP